MISLERDSLQRKDVDGLSRFIFSVCVCVCVKREREG